MSGYVEERRCPRYRMGDLGEADGRQAGGQNPGRRREAMSCSERLLKLSSWARLAKPPYNGLAPLRLLQGFWAGNLGAELGKGPRPLSPDFLRGRDLLPGEETVSAHSSFTFQHQQPGFLISPKGRVQWEELAVTDPSWESHRPEKSTTS